ncbi:tetratricopeptide repeat protein [Paenibacillus plantiphilus]|uniref:tetratricopeptide repeat protein n=1 Tax=Paenibacillus plantiphilus TaxID=2905650 RepID=UPI0025B64DB8|nr:tetratricopeptide repeat protein [Paenibacillus plantiphilus]
MRWPLYCVRTFTIWMPGYAYQLQGDYAAAARSYTEAITISEAIGHYIITIMAAIGLGNLKKAENQLHLADETYRRVLDSCR